jgi:hypothetical protein
MLGWTSRFKYLITRADLALASRGGMGDNKNPGEDWGPRK